MFVCIPLTLLSFGNPQLYLHNWYYNVIYAVVAITKVMQYYHQYVNNKCISTKICITEVYLLKYYFESHLMYKWRYYRQTIFNQLNIMVPNVDIIGLYHSLAILWEIYVMRHICHVSWNNFHFKRMAITGLC